MSNRTGSAEELARLKRERDLADRAYNDALTALDATVQQMREFPHPPPEYDEFQVSPLNQHWDLSGLKPPAVGGRWLRRIQEQIWAIVSPFFARQEAFNAAVVDHVNRNITTHRGATRAIESLLAVQREELERLIHFQTRLILWAQQITLYVDTKDRYVEGLMHGLAAGLSGLSDELQRRWESMVAREQRYQAQVEDVRGSLAVLHQATQTLRRETERPRPAEGTIDQPQPAPASAATAIDSSKYVGFEDQFRGSPADIRQRMTAYLPLFQGASDVVDIGCGRGEFLDLLGQNGVPAKGVDINDEMIAICRSRGLDAVTGDALGYLLAQPDGSLGGLFGAQVVEHLEPGYLMRLLDAAYHKLRPGSTIVLETINAACWYAFFSSYVRDITHVRPLHPDTLRYLVVGSGFQRVEIRYSMPVSDETKLQPLRDALARPSAAQSPDPLAEVAMVFNENVRRLNDQLFTNLDYAVIGERR